MAVDDHLPIQPPLSATSTLSSSSSSRRQLVQVATNNSSTFIQFPTTSRRQLLCIPTDRSRAISSKTRPVSCRTDIRSISNTHSSNIPITDRTQQKFNPILNNSLLNHRKEQPKSSSIKISTDYSLTTRLCLSSNSPKTEHQTSTIRAHTPPQIESSISEQPNENEDNDQQETQQLDKSKYDYITRWLQEVEQAKSSTGTFAKTKRSKMKCIQT